MATNTKDFVLKLIAIQTLSQIKAEFYNVKKTDEDLRESVDTILEKTIRGRQNEELFHLTSTVKDIEKTFARSAGKGKSPLNFSPSKASGIRGVPEPVSNDPLEKEMFELANIRKVVDLFNVSCKITGILLDGKRDI